MVASTVEIATTVYEREIVGAVPEDLLSCVRVLKKCKNKSDCLVTSNNEDRF